MTDVAAGHSPSQPISPEVQKAMGEAMQKTILGMSKGFSDEAVNEIIATLAANTQAFPVIDHAHRQAIKFVELSKQRPHDEEMQSMAKGMFPALTMVCAILQLPKDDERTQTLLLSLAGKLAPILERVDEFIAAKSQAAH